MTLRLLLLAPLFACVLSSAAPERRKFGFQASLGASSGDLRDTTDRNPCLDLGLNAEFEVRPGLAVRGRLDGLFFATAHRTGTGTDTGTAWTRRLDTRVEGWSLGAEGLAAVPGLPRLRLGGGLHAVRWRVDGTSTLVIAGPDGGTVVERNTPAWTRLGASLLADLRITGRTDLEVRLLRSPYGWEGERVNVLQVGLVHQF